MNEFSEIGGFPSKRNPIESFSHNSLDLKQEKLILSKFSPEEQEIIKEKQKVLSSLGYFIGKDFDMPIYLNEPGKGWHWNFQDNHIKIDPKDLVEKPMDYLRFVIAHEGGHRRISRTDFIPKEVWNQPGFASMMNCIEDPRMNNFVAEAYPRFKEQMLFSYNIDEEIRQKVISEGTATLGHVPKHELAGCEYIRQWIRDVKSEPFAVDETLPDDVKSVVQKTLKDAQESWWRYPSKKEADTSEAIITRYAKASYEINNSKVWPLFKELVEKDLNNQELEEFLKDLKNKLKDQPNNLDDQEKKDLEKAIQEAIKKDLEQDQKKSEGQENSPINLDQIPESVKEKIGEFIKSLPKEDQEKLRERAEQAIKDFDKSIDEMLRGKFEDQKEKDKDEAEQPPENLPVEKIEKDHKKLDPSVQKEINEAREKMREILNTHESVYEETMQEVLPIIDALENDLREIFTARRAKKWETGFRTGRKIDIKKRIQEKAKNVNVFESYAWQKRERPDEKDYAITLLVDLSGSMRGTKIKETFKAAVVLSEVLNKLSINVEILGFNDRLYPYQKFEQNLTDEMRKNMGDMLDEISSSRAAYNDDGWAVSEASKLLAKQKASEKFLIVLSDGLPEESSEHSGGKYDLDHVIKEIGEKTDQKLIGLGIGSGTEHVENYYPNSVANISTAEMAQKLADIIREAIANYQDF